jgi:chorismate synthase
MLQYTTAGESHGKTMIALVDGFPTGVKIDTDLIDRELARRQGGYGRGRRQLIETDKVEILTGVWRGETLGSPIALQVVNRDYKLESMEDLERPRPGHGDLPGSIKHFSSIRAILERASARETVARVAAGALAKHLLLPFGIEAFGYVAEIGGVAIPPKSGTPDEWRRLRDESAVYSLNPDYDEQLKKRIDEAKQAGDTLGGVLEIQVFGVPIGLGTHTQWNRKLDGRLAQAAMAVQAMKGVEIGLGFEAARRPGSRVHDPIQFDPAQVNSPNFGYVRPTNNAGGLEAGTTNGQPIVVRVAMKPISTLAKPLQSIDMETKQPSEASFERSDICAIAAASVVLENVIAFEVAAALVDKFGGDSLREITDRWKLYGEAVRNR